MNTYKKYYTNVFVASCDKQHEKGSIITLKTRRGKEHECVVYNYLGIDQRDGKHSYSIVRADGFNYKEYCLRRAERRQQWANSATKKGREYYNRSNKDRDFLSLGEPIKVGHHSERRHRKAIQDANANFGKYIEQEDKANTHLSKSEYWEHKANTINLSMPESIDYFEHKLEEAIKYHTGLKDGSIKREHSYSLTYAKKAVNNLTKKYEIAKRLWE